MAERNEKVQERIREELAKNPGASTKELQAAAQGVDSSVGGLSLRQFNAGYVLPLKRTGGRGKQRGNAPAKAARGAGRGGGRGAGRKPPVEAAPKPAPRARAAAAAAPPAGDRDRVRATLLEFARDFSAAESRSAIVGVLSNLDRYVDKIVGSRR